MDKDPVIDQLVKVIYSPSTTAFQTQHAVRSFRENAGFIKGSGADNDKWLQALSVDDVLQSVASAFTHTRSLNINKLSKTDLQVFKNLCLEKSSLTPNSSFERLLAHALGQQNEVEVLSCLSRVFVKLNERLMYITPETMLMISKRHPKLLDLCYESYKRASGINSSDHWLITSSFQCPQLYSTFCDYMLKTKPDDLPAFVSLCSQRGKLFTLYSDQEQSLVLLIETSALCDTKVMQNFTVKRICEGLMKLTKEQPEAAFKLLHHFPCLGDKVVEYCDECEAARQVCLWTLTFDAH